MFFWKRKKKEPDFESKMGELNTTVLSKKDYKNTGKIEQYVVERLEQMIELTKELDDEKEEYRIVTSYLNDIETLEKIPKEERDKISVITFEELAGMFDAKEIDFNTYEKEEELNDAFGAGRGQRLISAKTDM